MLNTKFNLLLTTAALSIRQSFGQGVGTELCACQPSVYELTLDFGLVCADSNVGGDGIFDDDCLIATRLPDTVNVTDLVPVTVSEIQIIELDQFQDPVGSVVYNDGPYFNGDIVTYTSIVRTTPEFITPVTLPRGFQVSINGNNADGQPIINTWGILYDNDCGIFPLLVEGQTIGWTIFSDLGDPPLKVCPIAPPTDFPTSSPVADRTAEPTVSLTSAPTESPVVSPVTPPSASPVVSRTEPPVVTPTGSPVASPPTETLAPFSGKRGGSNVFVNEDYDDEEDEEPEPEAEPEEPVVEDEKEDDKKEVEDDSYDNGALAGKRGEGNNNDVAQKKSKQYSGKMSKISKSKKEAGSNKNVRRKTGTSQSYTSQEKAGRNRSGKGGGKGSSSYRR